jgi:hypothetical protein
MNEKTSKGEKLQHPATYFDEPHEVVVDHALSTDEKAAVLDTLEQDARQLAEAASEGMASGEHNKLHDVLVAKDELGLPPVKKA